MADFHLDAADEFTHSPDGSANFNESVYVNAANAEPPIGGWMRLGNRVGEGHAELAVCLYLPNGRIACRFARPAIADNDRLDAGGLRHDVLRPLQQVRMTYEGAVAILDDADVLRDATRLAAAPRMAASVAWDLTGVSPAHGGTPAGPDVETLYGRDFSLGHFNQHARVRGHVRVGDEQWDFDGGGWRDHSWGPRHWHNLSYHRLFTATFPDGRGLMLLKIGGAALRARRRGVLLVDGVYEEVIDLDLATDWTAAKDPARVRMGVRTARRAARIDAEIVGLAPLRNQRRVGERTLALRVAEGFTRFTWNGAATYGMSEYGDRLGDTGPLGYPL